MEENMTRWEYCKVDASQGKMIKYNLGGTKVSKISDVRNLPELVIARLGNTGWEAFHVENEIWYFKRPITE
jgi:hypothetical protein